MQTILEILRKSTDFLQRKGVENARFDAQQLIAHGLGIGRMDLYLQFDRPLDEAELAKLRDLVARRGRREPLQHILGSTGFRGLDVKCDGRALVPRQETEQMVELALKAASAETGSVLEIGTGTGAPILSFAQERPGWKCAATDLSPDALALARENAARNGLEGRVEWFLGDLCAPVAGRSFDVAMANLPYVATGELETLQPEVKRDPALALDGGPDGLDVVRRLLAEAPDAVVPGGVLVLEVGMGHRPAVEALAAADSSWTLEEYGRDLEGVDRFPVLRRNA